MVTIIGSNEPPAEEPISQDKVTIAVQKLLDDKAIAMGYDNIFTAVSYVDDPNPKYAAEALALKNWRSAVWTYCTNLLEQVQTNQITITSVSEVINQLPTY